MNNFLIVTFRNDAEIIAAGYSESVFDFGSTQRYLGLRSTSCLRIIVLG